MRESEGVQLRGLLVLEAIHELDPMMVSGQDICAPPAIQTDITFCKLPQPFPATIPHTHSNYGTMYVFVEHYSQLILRHL